MAHKGTRKCEKLENGRKTTEATISREKYIFILLLRHRYNFCSIFFFPNESPSSYNAILFDNRNSFTGEKIQYTTFASWVDTIIDKLHVRDRGKLLL